MPLIFLGLPIETFSINAAGFLFGMKTAVDYFAFIWYNYLKR